MNFKQIPIIATPITGRDLAQIFKLPFAQGSYRQIFTENLKKFFNRPHCHLVCSGRASGYAIFKALSGLTDKKEVIIPAYVCASVVAAIKKAGLKVRLCDISLDTFQMDIGLLEKGISSDTLCIVAVHLFGLACDVERINQIGAARGIYVVEDFAQSFGTVIDNRESGTHANIGFTSFGRGKNLPTYTGGLAVTDDEEISYLINSQIESMGYPTPKEKIDILGHLLLFSLIVNPYIHKLFHKIILFLKGEDYPILDLELLQYTDFQAAIGNSILGKFNLYREKRYKNGMFLYERLKGFGFLKLPKILENSKPAFNRLPVLFNDKTLREKVENKLLKAGIISCRLYMKPMHKLYPDFWDGRGVDPFPNASKFSENSLTLPTHPLVDEETLNNIVRVFKTI